MSRSRLTPIALSILVNLALIGVMARVLISAPSSEQRYIAVELQSIQPRNVQHPTLNVQRPKPSGQQPAVGSQRSAPTVHRPASTIDHRPSAISRTTEVAGLQQSFTSGGGGTSATGPGAFVGPGSGGGISGSGESTITIPQPAPTPNTQHPTPAPPPTTQNPQPITPTPPSKGESRAPSAAEQTRPVYPSDAKDDGVEGIVTILALIDPEGKVTDTRLEKSSGDRRLDRAALDAVGKWTYNPCLRDGVPVKSSVRVKVDFRLE